MADGFSDTDFVYVDPLKRVVIGPVEWTKTGTAKPLERPEPEEAAANRRNRPKRRFPWGSYRSLKKLFRLEGKEKNEDKGLTLDEAMAHALKEPYWD